MMQIQQQQQHYAYQQQANVEEVPHAAYEQQNTGEDGVIVEEPDGELARHSIVSCDKAGPPNGSVTPFDCFLQMTSTQRQHQVVSMAKHSISNNIMQYGNHRLWLRL